MNKQSSFGRSYTQSPRSVPTAAVPVHPLSGAAVSICTECEGVGFFCGPDFHPDDSRLQAHWDCENCDGLGEVEGEGSDYPRLTNFPGGTNLSIEQVQDRIARVFLGVAK